ncbi:MAG: hypothetical protein WCE54_16115 [Ignavibacteriaceae bacterium]
MVRLKEGMIFGKPSGKMKNVVYRIMNGQPFASKRPLKYNASKSKAAVSQRAKFAVAVEFAKYINSISVLSNIWKAAKIKGTTSFNRLIKFNLKYVNEKSPTMDNLIIPGDCPKNLLKFPSGDLLFCPEEKMVKIIFSSTAEETDYNRDYDLVFVFMFYNPVNKKEKYFLLDYRQENLKLNPEKNEIIINLDLTVLKKASKYNYLVIYFSAITCKSGNLSYLWSNTLAKEFPLGKII